MKEWHQHPRGESMTKLKTDIILLVLTAFITLTFSFATRGHTPENFNDDFNNDGAINLEDETDYNVLEACSIESVEMAPDQYPMTLLIDDEITDLEFCYLIKDHQIYGWTLEGA